MKYLEIWNKIESANSIALLSHINPDGDTLGCALGVYAILKSSGKNVTLVNKTADLPQRYSFLTYFDKIKSELPKKCDLIVSFDSASFDRLGIEKQDVYLINIDHHQTNTLYGDLNLIDSSKVSTTVVVYELLKECGVKINRECATALYCGLVTDSGFFQFDRVDEVTFKVASELVGFGADPLSISNALNYSNSLSKIRALGYVLNSLELDLNGRVATIFLTEEMLKKSGATISDSEDFVNFALSLVSIEVAIFLRESDTGVRVSLRSKNYIDVSTIAKKFGGGGHNRAGGANLIGLNLQDCKQLILKEIKLLLKDEF